MRVLACVRALYVCVGPLSIRNGIKQVWKSIQGFASLFVGLPEHRKSLSSYAIEQTLQVHKR